MRHNSFSGEIPDLSSLQYLERLWLDTQSPGGGLTGNIDWMENAFPYLHSIHIENNSLNGTIPQKLCAMKDDCHASGNKFDCPKSSCCDVSACSKQQSTIVLRRRYRTRQSPLPDICTFHQ